MEHGQRRQRSTLRSAQLFMVAWWTGASSTSLLGFASCRMDSPAHVISHICYYWCDCLRGLCIAWRTPARDHSEARQLSLFLDLSRSLSRFFITVPINRLVAISVLAFCGPWFRFSLRDSYSRLPPRGTTVNGDGVAIRVTVREEWIPHPDRSLMTAQCHVSQSREVVRQGQQTQPYPDWGILVAERAADTLVHWEGSKPPTPST